MGLEKSVAFYDLIEDTTCLASVHSELRYYEHISMIAYSIQVPSFGFLACAIAPYSVEDRSYVLTFKCGVQMQSVSEENRHKFLQTA